VIARDVAHRHHWTLIVVADAARTTRRLTIPVLDSAHGNKIDPS
jgi:hypothetical protein